MEKEFLGNRKTIASTAFALFMLAVMLLSGIILSGCSSNVTNSKYKNAIYIYMCGSTLETKNSVATKHINDILEANVSKDTAVIIETGGTRTWRGHDIPNDALVRYRVKNGQLVELEREEDASMGDAKTLSSFLNFCKENYPAENKTLLFWNHGAGSVKGVCLDENHNFDGLSATEINEALDETNSHFTNVCFDACLMANYETARVVANHAETMIASQEIEPSSGWDYKTLIEDVSKGDYDNRILESYKKQCEDKGKRLWTLSAISLEDFAKLESAFDSFVNSNLSSNNLQTVTNAAIQAMNFGEQNGKSNLVDLGQMSEFLGNESLSQAIETCTKTVNGEDRQGASGMSIFFPLSGSADLEEYLTSETSEAYSLFLGSKFITTSTTDTIKFSDVGSISDTTFKFSVTPTSAHNIQSVVYDIYQLHGNEPATCLGFDNDVDSNGQGEFSISFSGKWVALNGNVLACEPIDTVGDTTVFSSPVAVNGEDADLRFTYNSNSREFSLQGVVPIEQDGTPGRLQDINIGDKITILSEKFVSKGSNGTEFVETASITVGDDLELSTITLPDGRYQIYAIITDLYGNEFLSNDYVFELKSGEVVESSVVLRAS